MVGADDEAFAPVEPLLRELGQAITHVGTNGQSLLLKLAVNISLAVQTLPFGEGVLLAERGRIDPQLAAEVMSTSSIGSPMLKARVPHPRPTPTGMVRRNPDGEGHPARA
jgi:3-hydroxyisobutyrate dehydrogenase-like beta-hydroxyacid dehydrogenase